jgi:hypothetical protein
MVVLTQNLEVYQLSEKSTPTVPGTPPGSCLGRGLSPSNRRREMRRDGGFCQREGKTSSIERFQERSMRSPRAPPPSLSAARLSDSPAIQSNPPRPYLQSGYQIVPLPPYSGSLAPDTQGQGGQSDDQTAPSTVGHRKPIVVTIQKPEPTSRPSLKAGTVGTLFSGTSGR